MNGGGTCYVVRIGGDGADAADGRGRAIAAGPQAAARPATASSAIEAGAGRQRHLASRSPTPAATRRPTTRSSSSSSRAARSSRSSTASRPAAGKHNVVTVVNAESKLIQLEEVGTGAPSSAPGTGDGRARRAAAAGRVPSPRLTADDYVGDVADRTGFGGLEAVDEVTMVCVPDLMGAYQQGVIDLEGVQAVQLAMIAHCELMGDRVAILDPPPGLNAQQIKEWRVDKAGYDSKYATLYWPWIKVFDPATGQNVFVPPSGHIAGIWARNDDTRGVHKAPANEVVRGAIALELQHHQGRARPAQPGRHQLHPGVPRPRHPGLGRAHAVERPGVALPQRPAAVQLPRGVDPRRHPVGRVRAERPTRCGRGSGARSPRSCVSEWRDGRAVRRTPGRGVLRQVRRRDQPARGHRRRPGRRARSASRR